jgi:hypothetical protein
LRIDKLKGINVKLRTKLKELNSLLEKTLEKANTRKLYKMNQGNANKQQDIGHSIKVKEKELKNAQTQIDQYKKEIAALQGKID